MLNVKMNKYMFSAIATALLISPFAVNAVSLNSETNNLTEMKSPVTQIAHGHKRGRHGGMKKLLAKLDLTPEQSQKIEEIHEQAHSDNEALYQEMQTNREEMRSLFTSDASTAELRQQHQELQGLRQQIGTSRFETKLQVREILTPEQRTKMAELMEQHRGKRGHHRS